MNILLVTKRWGGTTCLCLTQGRLLAMAFGLLVGLPLLASWLGYTLGKGPVSMDPLRSQAVMEELDAQQQRIEEARLAAQENINALTMRLGQMQAHVMRLDAMGQRITRIAGLDDGEFDFSNPPAQGGPEESGSLFTSAQAMPDFVTQLEELARQLENREQQLSILENMIMNRNLQAEIMPAGRPVTKGWISSRYGVRNDPFTGKAAFHNGIDLAAPEGSEVVAVAAGVVTWAGKRYGYGNLIEINHGNGYLTRYGHLKTLLVSVGETVRKGHHIANLGNTGRSTGPHVHFEVWVDGKSVDPMKYVRASN